uniref:PNPLA domain-containing protein n=1 Tax=Meloidogyne javanica TaxID=6303 RepID=A0A915MLX6_MELJA
MNIAPPSLVLFRSYQLPEELTKGEDKMEEMGYVDRNVTTIWKAARCSSAAPTYFPPFDDIYVDGGVICNNPTMELLTEFVKLRPYFKLPNPHCVISIGTGTPPSKSLTIHRSFIWRLLQRVSRNTEFMRNMAQGLVEQITESNRRPVMHCSAFCAALGVPFFRFSPRLSDDVRINEVDDACILKMLWDVEVAIHRSYPLNQNFNSARPHKRSADNRRFWFSQEEMSMLKKTPLFCAKECATFLDLLLSTRSKESQVAASLYFRKKLAACQEPPEELVETIILELINCLRRPSNELQLNASWALTNLACGSRQETHRIIASGGIDALVHVASTTVGEIRDQAIWALGNLAADCASCRQQVRASGLLALLIVMLEMPDYQAHDPRKIVIWCLANLLRGGMNDIELDSVGRLLSSLHVTLSLNDTGEILCDAVWCIAYLIDHATIEGERSDSLRALTGALRTVGNIITGTDEQTTAILDLGVLEDLSDLVNSNVHQISRECLWILSNVAAGTSEHVTRLFSVDGMAQSVFQLAYDQSPRKRKEAYWVVVNAMMGAPPSLYEYLMSGGLAQILVQLLEENLDAALLERTLNTMQHSLQDRSRNRLYTIALFRRVGLVEQIAKIAFNNSTLNEVDPASNLAATILQQHFGIHIGRAEGGGNIRGVGRRNEENEEDIVGQNVVNLRCIYEESVELASAASTSRNVNQNSSEEQKSILVRIKRMDETCDKK